MVINDQIDKLLTVREVASMLHVHTNTLRRWSDAGTIKSLRITPRGDRRYRMQDILEFLNGSQVDREL